MCVHGRNRKTNYYPKLSVRMAMKLVKVPGKALACNRNWSSPRSSPVVPPIIISKSIWSTPPPPQEEQPNCKECIENTNTTYCTIPSLSELQKEEERNGIKSQSWSS